MRLARYVGEGKVEIVDEPSPALPAGGLRVRTEACGLCSGELMAWYMERKLPHVLGHECAGVIVESEAPSFPVGRRVFVHHHAPCGHCEPCRRGAVVHCSQWKRTRLTPGGMSEEFVCGSENLTDALLVDDLRPRDAALIEPLGCVAKSLRLAGYGQGERAAVVGLGFMGGAHAALMPGCVGYELNPARRVWAAEQGIDAREPSTQDRFPLVVLCPGSEAALRFALEIAAPSARVVLFAPLPPRSPVALDLEELYFREVSLVPSYSCGPQDTAQAAAWLRERRVRAEQLVSDFIRLDQLPEAYIAMRDGAMLKPMVEFEPT